MFGSKASYILAKTSLEPTKLRIILAVLPAEDLCGVTQ